MTRLLVTGFGRFPGAAVNPTGAIVRAIGRQRLAGMTVRTAILPTVYGDVAQRLPAMIADWRPDAVLMFGLSGRRGAISVERHGANRTLRRLPDAARAYWPTLAIEPGGARRRTTAVKVGAVATLLSREGLRARPSLSAGTYLCNFAYWLALGAVARGETGAALFIHVPRPVAGSVPKRRGTKRRVTARDLDRAGLMVARAMTGRPAIPFRHKG